MSVDTPERNFMARKTTSTWTRPIHGWPFGDSHSWTPQACTLFDLSSGLSDCGGRLGSCTQAIA
eukprot:6312426-Alexandrium_andersonii.AAC.1